MNNDHASMTAISSANPCGRSDGRVPVLSAAACRVAVACVLAWSAFGSIGSVQAQDRGGSRREDGQQQQQQQQQPPHRDEHGDRNAQRQDAPRYEPRPDDGHRQQDRNAEAQRRSGRLTADERRDLRRQINEAGMDLYPQRQH